MSYISERMLRPEEYRDGGGRWNYDIPFDELNDQPHLASERESTCQILLTMMRREIACMAKQIIAMVHEDADAQQRDHIEFMYRLMQEMKGKIRRLEGRVKIGCVPAPNPLDKKNKPQKKQ